MNHHYEALRHSTALVRMRQEEQAPMHTQVPRFASQLRLGLFVFIITCLSIGTGISFSQIADPQNPSHCKSPRYSHVGIARWRHPALGQRRPRWFRQGNCLFARWKTPRGCKRHRHLDLRCRDGARTYPAQWWTPNSNQICGILTGRDDTRRRNR